MANKVVVVGSTNVDKTLNVKKYALPGETLSINSHQVSHGGGKGANQAIAASRSGADTAFITKLGQDVDGNDMIANFKEDKLDVNDVINTTEYQTGQAYITVDATGQNSIYVYGGANMSMTPKDVRAHEQKIADADILIAQLEIPIPAIVEAFKIAKENDVKTILNPAPAKRIPEELLNLTDIITPNETESQSLTGIEVNDEPSMLKSAQYFFDKGISTVIITVGDKGSFYASLNKHAFVPAFKVKAVDTTAAGDTFIGAFAAKLKTDDSNIEEAMIYANHASSLTVQVAGAQNSIPTETQVLEVINKKNKNKEQIEAEKKEAAEAVAKQIPDGIVLGLGSGTTAAYFVKAINDRVKNEGLNVQCVATSLGTQRLAEDLGLNMLDVNTIDKVDITVDGADAVDHSLNGIKGGGAALLFEKLVAKMSDKNIWIVDSTKYHKTLAGQTLPIEVIPFGGMGVFRYLKENGYQPEFRFKENGDVLETDSGNYLINIKIPEDADLNKLAENLKNHTGVVEHGLFLNICDQLVIGQDNKIKIINRS